MKFDQIGLEQGLSQSTVYAIVQDAQGFMWFGTQDGLNKYDGYSITVFRHNPADSTTISDNTIFSLLCDRKGDLWIGTMRGGIDRYVPSENRFYHYRHKDNVASTVSENDITSLFEDTYGRIWAGTQNSGLNMYDRTNNKFVHFNFGQKDNSGSESEHIGSICQDKSSNLWVATNRGLLRMRMDSLWVFARYIFNPSDPASISNSNIRSLYLDKEGNIWAGTWGGSVNCYDSKNNKFLRYKLPGSSSGDFIISMIEDLLGLMWITPFDGGLVTLDRKTGIFTRHFDYTVMTLCQDKSGIIWAGTLTNGIKTYDFRKNMFRQYHDNNAGLNSNLVQAILEDSDGELWIGNYGSGLQHFNHQRTQFRRYLIDPLDSYGLSSNKILSLCQTSDGNIWVGTEDGVINRFDKKLGKFFHYPSRRHWPILVLYQTRYGCLWAGNRAGLYRFYLKNNTLTIPQDKNKFHFLDGKTITALHECQDNSLWVGTLRSGVYHFSSGYDLIRGFLPGTKPGKSVNNNSIISIYEDVKGKIWMGTYGGGLNKYDPVTDSFSYFTSEVYGLSNDVVYGILPDKRGDLWLSTNKGISRFDPKSKTFHNFDISDGLQSNEFNQGAYFTNSKGELFFGGIKGFNSFFPDKIRENDHIPPVYLTDFRVFDKSLTLPAGISFTKKIQLSYFQNFFSFEFVALNYTSPEKNQYSYMLEGFDKVWHKVAASHRYAGYTNLDPGKYILRIKGSNNDGIWNEQGATVIIIITPPFWMTWWFAVLIALILIGILYLMHKYRLNKLLAVERTRLSISQDLHDDVSASITGIVYFVHALISSLNEKITPDVQKLLSLINENAVNVQESMSDIIWSINPGNDKWNVILPKFRRYASDLCESKKIKYSIDIPQEIITQSTEMEMRYDLWLIFKELVTNSVKHSYCSQLVISISELNNYLYLNVTDDGIGFDPSITTERNGIKNIYTRIKSINGKIDLVTAPGKGTRWSISIPLKKTNNRLKWI
jgi:ligand-binding sensor domain-containing protein